MARIRFEDLAHSYDGRSWALKPMTMTWEDGGAYALLGPSGCGKSTLLNIISGIRNPTRGRVLFDDLDVTQLAPEARSIAQVFQFPIIYDTMTVFENLAFPLRNRGWTRERVRERVGEIGELLELNAQFDRRARDLPAESKQKISLGRGLVRPDVAAVLLDEPLTVIDPHMKWLLRRKLKQVHQELKVTLIYVTHDQTEALTFADSIVVMTQGEVLQTGSAEELFEAPAHRFVGNFIGNPGMNFIPCEWNGEDTCAAGVAVRTASVEAPRDPARLAIGIRPEYLQVTDRPGENSIPAQVVSVRDQGASTLVELRLGGQSVWAKLSEPGALPAMREAYAHLPPGRCALYADGRRLA